MLFLMSLIGNGEESGDTAPGEGERQSPLMNSPTG